MSSECTFGDNSDEFCIFRYFLHEFGWPWPHRVSDHSDTDVVMTACTSGADKGNQTVHTHATRWSDRQGESDCLITLWSKQEILRSIFRSMQCESLVCESVERVHGVDPRLMRSMNRICFDCWYLWYAVCTWKPEADQWYSRSTDWGRDRRGEQIFWSCATVSWTFTLMKSKCFQHELVSKQALRSRFV